MLLLINWWQGRVSLGSLTLFDSCYEAMGTPVPHLSFIVWSSLQKLVEKQGGILYLSRFLVDAMIYKRFHALRHRSLSAETVSSPFFPVPVLHTEIYSVKLLAQCEYSKIQTKKTPFLGHFWYSNELR